MNKQALYEIFRACRLCGSGAGYKMPIVQNIIVMDDVDVDLRQKIKDCVRIEIQDDTADLHGVSQPVVSKTCKKVAEILSRMARKFIKMPISINEQQETMRKFRSIANFPKVIGTIDCTHIRVKKTNADGGQLYINRKGFSSINVQVNLDDKMPPLVCELCIDKVNGYYEFLQLCKKTDLNTRLKLGLPLSLPEESLHPVLKKEADEKPANNREQKKLKTKDLESDLKIKVEKDAPSIKSKNQKNNTNKAQITLKSAKQGQNTSMRPHKTPRTTRRSGSDPDDVSLSKLTEPPKRPKLGPRAVVNKDKTKNEALSEGLKRCSRELEQLLGNPLAKKKKVESSPAPAVPLKSLKTATKLPPKSSSKINPGKMKRRDNAINESVKEDTNVSIKENKVKKGRNSIVFGAKSIEERMEKKKTENNPVNDRSVSVKAMGVSDKFDSICVVCDLVFRNRKERANHYRKHKVTFTQNNKACNACREWFENLIEAHQHHARHREEGIPYRCMLCSREFDTYGFYENHITNNECRASTEVPDVKCEECWKYFPTMSMLDEHKCCGEGDRPAMCIICNETVAARHLKKHEKSCTPKKGLLGSTKVDQDVLDRLKPMQVRVAKCDPLLSTEGGYCDTSTIIEPHGLDQKYHYPYMMMKPRIKIKTEPCNRMVTINDDVKAEFDYTNWDSGDDNEEKNVPSLSCLCLKTIYTSNLFDKLPKTKGFKKEFHSFNIEKIMSKLSNRVIHDANLRNSPIDAGMDKNFDKLDSDENKSSNNSPIKESLNDCTRSSIGLDKINNTENSLADIANTDFESDERNSSNVVTDYLKSIKINVDNTSNLHDFNNKIINNYDNSVNNKNNDVNNETVNDIEPTEVHLDVENISNSTNFSNKSNCIKNLVNNETVNEDMDTKLVELKDSGKGNNISEIVKENLNMDSGFTQNKEHKELISAIYCSNNVCISDDTLIRTIDAAVNDIDGKSVDSSYYQSESDNVQNGDNNSEMNKSETEESLSDTIGHNNDTVSVTYDSVNSVLSSNDVLEHNDSKVIKNTLDCSNSNVVHGEDVFRRLNESIALINNQCQANINNTVESDTEYNCKTVVNNLNSSNNSHSSVNVTIQSCNDNNTHNDKLNYGIDNLLQSYSGHDNDKCYKNDIENESFKDKFKMDVLHDNKNTELEGMDLDNVSDDDFNFE